MSALSPVCLCLEVALPKVHNETKLLVQTLNGTYWLTSIKISISFSTANLKDPFVFDTRGERDLHLQVRQFYFD
jgi:hypothetical protein